MTRAKRCEASSCEQEEGTSAISFDVHAPSSSTADTTTTPRRAHSRAHHFCSVDDNNSRPFLPRNFPACTSSSPLLTLKRFRRASAHKFSQASAPNNCDFRLLPHFISPGRDADSIALASSLRFPASSASMSCVSPSSRAPVG